MMYDVEFQKRGLPHAHILIILDCRDKILEPEPIDSIIRAELPHPRLEEQLYGLVRRHMIHRKCGANQLGVTCQGRKLSIQISKILCQRNCRGKWDIRGIQTSRRPPKFYTECQSVLQISMSYPTTQPISSSSRRQY